MGSLTFNKDHSKPSDHKKTTGELAFDWGVYGGIGFLVNAALSVGLTYGATMKRGTALNKMYINGGKAWDKIVAPFYKDAEAAKGASEFMNRLLFLSSGGYILLVPMKMIEDRKEEIVDKLDDWMGTGPETQEQELQEDLYFDQQPKQSYGSLLAGRIIAHPIIVSGAYPIMQGIRGSEKLADFMGKHCNGFFKNFPDPAKMRGLVAEELILSATGAAMLYGFSKTIAAWKHTSPNQQENQNANGRITPQIGEQTAAQFSNVPLAHVQEATHAGAVMPSPEHTTHLSS